MDLHLASYYIGIVIILASHLFALKQVSDGLVMNSEMIKKHSYVNLLAVLMIAYYFANKEGYVAW